MHLFAETCCLTLLIIDLHSGFIFILSKMSRPIKFIKPTHATSKMGTLSLTIAKWMR